MRPGWLALVLLAGCAGAPAPPRGATPSAPPAPPSAPAAADSTRALARLAAWEKRLPERWKVEQRGTVGPFSFVVAHESNRWRGAVATAAGLLADLPLREVWTELRDLDGDGRAELAALTLPDPDLGPASLAFESIADRPDGPARLPVDGLEPRAYTQGRWAAGGKPAIELGWRPGPPHSQTFAWNGKALAPLDQPFLYLTWEPVGRSGDHARLVGLAHGKRFERDLGSSTFRSFPDENPGDFGDGPRFFLFHWVAGWTDGMSQDEMDDPRHELIALRLDPGGFRETNLDDDADLSTLRDRDGDRVPELEVPLRTVSVAACHVGVAEPCQELEVNLRELSAWSGDAFASDHAALAPAYLAWAAEASRQGKGLVDAGCSPERLEFALQAYLGLRRGGRDAATARAEATAIVRASTLGRCTFPEGKSRRGQPVPERLFKAVDDILSPPPPRPPRPVRR